MNGMVFTRNNPSDANACHVFIVVGENKVITFDCKNEQQEIIEKIQKLKLGVSSAPSFFLMKELPVGATVSSTGALSKESLLELIRNNGLDRRTARTKDEIVLEYSKTDIYDGNRRKELRNEYIKTLSETEQLAIWLHEKTCHLNHTDYCGFYHEIHGVEDDWSAFTHAQYLKKATNLMALAKNDVDLIHKMVNILKEH